MTAPLVTMTDLRMQTLARVRDLLHSGADDPDEQVAYLLRLFADARGCETEGGLLMDELAMDLDDAATNLRVLEGEGVLIPSEVMETLTRANDLLSEWSGEDKGNFWYSSGLRTHPVWAEVRVLCRMALAALEPVTITDESNS